MAATDINPAGPERGTAFFGRTYDDTMGLLLSARHYVTNIQPGELAHIEMANQLYLNCEALRLTTQLSQVMAWLLAQKAVAAGELTLDQVREEAYRLGAHTLCLVDTDARVAASSPRLAELLAQGRRLFERVARLDRQLDI